jgi:hypothetical protein
VRRLISLICHVMINASTTVSTYLLLALAQLSQLRGAQTQVRHRHLGPVTLCTACQESWQQQDPACACTMHSAGKMSERAAPSADMRAFTQPEPPVQVLHT